MSFINELKRRNVVRVGIAYVVAAWLLLQLTEVLTELLEIGPEVGKIVIVLIIVGFVPALLFAWAFELTPDGLKRESEVDRSGSVARQTGQKLNIAIIAMLVVIAGYFIWESRFKIPAAQDIAESVQQADLQDAADPDGTGPSAPAGMEAPIEKSIVVLPFVNMSADASQEYFSDGLSEEILNALVPIENLRVISRTSAFAFKGKGLSVPQIAEQLGVTHVLEGSVRTAGDDLRITAQLIEVASDSHLWSQAYNRKMENVFEVQEDISAAIATELQLRLAGDRLAGRPTQNIEAYQLFLRGRHHYQMRGIDNLDLAQEVLEEAIELDPEFDQAWANLAATLVVLSFYAEDDHKALFNQAVDAAEQAIAINPNNGFAHAVLGLTRYGQLDFEEAIARLNRAIALNPNESNSYLWKGIMLSSLGYIDQSIATMKHAETFDPAFTNLHNWLAQVYTSKGDSNASLYHRDLAVAINPAVTFNYTEEHAWLEGGLSEVEELVREAWAGQVESEGGIMAEAYLAALRDPAQTDDAVARIVAYDGIFFPTPDTFWLFALGAVDEALESLREYMAAGRTLRSVNSFGMFWFARFRDDLSDPAMIEFFEEFGLADYWREHGDPDYCRSVGDSFECGTP